jgi:hypothetical protein
MSGALAEGTAHLCGQITAFLNFCLSGFYDVLYLPKRRRVNRLTAARAA